MKRLIIELGLSVLLAMMLSGCNLQPPLGTDGNPMVWVLLPSHDNQRLLDDAQRLTALLRDASGIVIKPMVASNYKEGVQALSTGKAQMSILDPFSYIVAHSHKYASAALSPVRWGSTFHASQIIVSRKSGIRSIAELRGKSFCRPDSFSASGWVIPFILMRNEGLDPGKDLAHIGDVGNPMRVIESVYDSIYDAGATCVDARDRLVGKLPDVKHRVLVISASHPIPNEAIAFGGKVPEEIQEKTMQTLLKVMNDKRNKNLIKDFYSWEGLVRTRDSFYDSLRETLSTAGVETKNFIK